MNIYNERDLWYFKTKLETYRRKTKATICYNCSGYYHATRNCHLRPKYIKCGGEHTTRDCSIKEKLPEPKCVNCGELGHLAAWKGCKALSIVKNLRSDSLKKAARKRQLKRRRKQSKQEERKRERRQT
ncbi:hypothetical protein AVEN_44106-1 [Araneus ventricosus]|uniref:Pre-C2HC domain-containing protein n=1 Tax=Araneus ventricosus TaxID=182803 RepID=A0A4Y2DAL6_ARAVE|nr:hypothetical protein AVEN_44106-1 [Araneus ventricosus]